MVRAFKSFDTDGNGTISKTEFGSVVKKLNMKLNAHQLNLLFDSVDKDEDGVIQFEELCCWLCDTPCFTKYFDLLGKIQKEYKRRVESVDVKGDARIKNLEAANKWMAKELDTRIRPTLKEIFNHADKDSNGVLSTEESILLFSNYAQTLAKHADTIIEISKSTWLDRHWDKKSFKKLVPKLQEMMNSQMANHEDGVDARHRKAFDVIDKNKDGQLMMDEVVDCLTPGTYRYREFHKALELMEPEGIKEAFEAKVLSSRPK